MSRRDTIIIAVLINVALLGILFTTAVNAPEESTIEDKIVTYTAPQPRTVNPPLIGTSTPQANRPTMLKPKVNTAIVYKPAKASSSTAQQRTQPSTPSVQSTQTLVAKPAATNVAKPSEVTVTVTVKRGDVLSKIAAANRTTVEAIMQANGLSKTTLSIGQQLNVPINTVAKKTVAKSQPKTTTRQEQIHYTVQKGDSPWKIARQNGVELAELLNLNGLDEQSARRLRPGDELRVR